MNDQSERWPNILGPFYDGILHRNDLHKLRTMGRRHQAPCISPFASWSERAGRAEGGRKKRNTRETRCFATTLIMATAIKIARTGRKAYEREGWAELISSGRGHSKYLLPAVLLPPADGNGGNLCWRARKPAELPAPLVFRQRKLYDRL